MLSHCEIIKTFFEKVDMSFSNLTRIIHDILTIIIKLWVKSGLNFIN